MISPPHHGRAIGSVMLGLLTVVGGGFTGSIGCRSQDESPVQRMSSRRIVVVGISRAHPTWPVLEATANQLVGRKKNLEIRVMAPEVSSPQAQMTLLESLRDDSFDAVCLHATDPTSIAPVADAMMRQGIPVVAFGTDLPGGRRSAYTGPDESDIGRAAALAAERLAHPDANSVILLHAGPENSFYAARYNAFRAAVVASSRITLLKELDGRGSRLAALEVIRSEARKYPRVAGVVLLDDWPLRALSLGERLLPEGRRIVLCSSDPLYHPDLRDGRIDVMLTYDYRESVMQAMYEAIRLTEDKLRGFSVVVEGSIEVLTRENLGDWRLRWMAWERGQPTSATSLPASEQ
jgi:ABC-type sugar transport system substrate-binding protein